MITLEALEKLPRSQALACSIGAGGALGVLAYVVLRFYENKRRRLFLRRVFCLSYLAKSCIEALESAASVKQLYLLDWPIVAALAWFMTIHVPQLGHKLLIGVCIAIFATAGAVSARRKRVRD